MFCSVRRLGVASIGLASMLFCGEAMAALGASVTLASGQPGTIYPGETTELQITLSNSNAGAAVGNVAFSASLPGTLPNGLKIAGAATYNCTDPSGPTTGPGSGTLTAAVGTQAISLSGGNIPARDTASSTDGSCTITVPVTAGTSTGNSATYTYTIGSGGVTGNDGSAVANVGAVNQSINVQAMSLPTIAKSFGASTLFLGGSTTTLTITVTNTNPAAIPGFSLTDTFPNIIKVAATPAATAVCNNGGGSPTFSPGAGDTSLSASGTIPAKVGGTNGTCTLTVKVEAAQTGGGYTVSATNTINKTTNFSNDLGMPAAANASDDITVKSPLRIAKSFAHSFLSGGQSDSLTITLFNDGNSPLTVSSFTDDPIDGVAPAGGGHPGYGLAVTGQSTTCAGGTASATTNNTGVSLAGGTIPANGSCTVTVNFTATPQTAGTPITYTNSISQGAVDVGDAAIVSQSASATITVADDLRVTKSATPASAAPGNPVRYSVTVENYGASALNNVAITDTFSNGLTFLTGTIGSNDYTPALSGSGCSGLTVTGATGAAAPVFTVGTLPARSNVNTPGSCTVTFYAMTAAGAANNSSTSNQIPAGGVCYNSGLTCNGGASNSAGGTVTTAILAATKTYNLTSPRPEGTITRMTITVSNLSANELTNVSIADTLPLAGSGGQMRIATPSNAASTCGTPTITAVPGSTSVAMNGGTVAARGSNGTGSAGTCILQVDVVAAAGTYTNSATVSASETYANGTTHSVGPVTATASAFTYASSLSATKSFSPAAVSSGGKSTVTVRLTNSGAGALSGVAVTDPLPSGMVVASPPNAYTTCAGTTTVTATAGQNSAAMSGAAIAGSSNCDFVFDVVASGSANWTNSIPIGNITADGGISNQTAVSAILTYNAPVNPTVSKATNPSTLTFPGQISQLTITISSGSQALSNLQVTDHFTTDGTSGAASNGMTIAPTPAAATTCAGGIVTATPGAGSVSLSGASLPASSSCTVTVNVTSTSVGGITNFIPASSLVTDQGLTNSGQATTSLTTQSNIGVVKQFTPNVIKPGERSRLRITFYNATAQTVSGLSVTDTLPAGVTVPAGPNPVTTCSGATVSSPASDQVQVSGGGIGAASGSVAASCYAEIDVTAASQGDYTNTIAASAVTATVGGSPATNSQPTSDILRVKSPLTVHKAFSSKTLDAGNPVGFTTGSDNKSPGTAATMTVRLDNPNNVQLTAAAFTDTLPTGLVVATTPSASTTCTGGTVTAAVSGTTVRLSGATIPAGGSCTLSVNVLSNISGSYTNTIPAGGVTTFEGVTNDSATSAQIVVSTPPTVSKQFAPAVIPPNGTSTLTIVLGNSNASAITLTSAFTDTLPTAPGSIVVAATPNVSKTCPGAVTAAAGSGTVTYANGATVPAGGCSISVNVTGATPGDHTNNIPASALQTDFGNNQQPANSVLSISTLGYVSGRVFKDNDLTPDGTYNNSDVPIQGASIELRSGATCGGALVSATGLTNPATTDALGNYIFAGLSAGTYSVCEPVQPSGTLNGTTTAGGISPVSGSTGTAGTASNPTSTTSQIVGIVLNGDGGGGAVSGSTGNNFAEIVASGIAGTVFLDQNDNGIQNAADTALSGVTVELLNGASSVIATTTTDSGGNYSFTGLSPGTYSVREPSQPANTANGKTVAGSVGNGGTAGTATAQSTVPSAITGIVLPPNTSSAGNNFAEVPTGRQIGGRVYLDAANDGIFNGSDSGIAGVTVTLAGTDFNGIAVNQTATTASDGRYTFAGLASGTYTVTEPNQPANTLNGTTTAGSTGGTATLVAATPSAISAIDLTGTNTISSNNDFAEIAPASIAGFVYLDSNDNGVQDGGEPGIAGVTVTLSGAAAATATTSADGSWSFTNLRPGTYVVTETQPGDYAERANSIGSAGGTDSSGAGGSQFSGIVLAVGQSGTGYLFGEKLGAISGFVYADANNNGIKDADEAGIANVRLTLSGASAAGAAVNQTATTDNAGAYVFTGVRNANAAGYTLVETQPANWLDGKETAGSQGGTVDDANFSADAAHNSISAIHFSAAAPAAGYDFGELQTTSITGKVYLDSNDNGAVDPGEPGIGNVTVTLTGKMFNGTAVELTTATAADGTFAFTGLQPTDADGYTLTEIQPAAYLDGRETAGTINGAAAGIAANTGFDATPANNRITGIKLASGQSAIDYLFGERGGNLHGFVYIDANDNGIKDASEKPLPGVRIRLSGTMASDGADVCGVAPSCVATTDAAGAFSFVVPPGTFRLDEEQADVRSYTDPSSPVEQPLADGRETAGVAGGTVDNSGFGNNAGYNAIGAIDVGTAALIAANGDLGGYLFGERISTALPTLKPPVVSGYVYLDTSHTRVRSSAIPDSRVTGWTVTLTAVRSDGSIETICSVQTDEVGFYHLDNLSCQASGFPQWINGLPTTGSPAAGGLTYQGFSVAFSNPGVNGVNTVPQSGGSAGTADAANDRITAIQLNPGDEIVEQNLPLDPSGVVYDAVSRTPVAGAVVSLLEGGAAVPPACLVSNQNPVTTGSNGFYEFLLILGPSCPLASGSHAFTLAVTPPAEYMQGVSTMIPPDSATHVPPVGGVDPIQTQAGPPTGSESTRYFLFFGLTLTGNPATSSSNVVNNHIPVDPAGAGLIRITKTSPLLNVSRGDLVPYTITAANTVAQTLTNVNVVDHLPPGFRYRSGSAVLDGAPVEPSVNGRDLVWRNQTFAGNEKKTVKMILVVGSGVGEGEYVNQAWAANGLTSSMESNVASATVRVVPDPDFDCTDIIGKVFDDKNANGYQDQGEPGIANVRVATPRGLLVTSDAEGRFHLTCADVPQQDHGSNFVMKLDERTLPSGYRLTTENPRDVRATRGKMVKLNFGATVHRVVRLELNAAAFSPDGSELLPEWAQRLEPVPERLAGRPSILRIAYSLAQGEDAALAKSRLDAVAARVRGLWHESGHDEDRDGKRNPLVIETEVEGRQ